LWTHRLTDCFRHVDYRRFWMGSMLTIVAFRMQDIVLGWQILGATDSAFWVGLAAFARDLPLLIWSPITGILADRMKRQWIIAAGMALACLASAGLALLTALGKVLPWHIIATSFLLGSAFTLYAPARLALLPNLVPTTMLLSASTVEYSSTRLMGFFGPLVAGVLVDMIGVSSTLMVQVALFILAALVFMGTGRGVGRLAQGGSERGSMWRGLHEVVAYLRQDQPLLALLVLGLVMVPFGMSYQKLMPVFARDVLGAGASTLGLMVGVSSLGAGLAGFSMAARGDVFRKGRALLLSSTMFSWGLVVFAFSSRIEAALALLFVLGLLVGVYLTLSNVLFQGRSPDPLRGRVMSAWGMVWGLLPFASLAMGGVAELLGVTTAVAICGAACGLFGIGMALAGSHLQEL